MSTSSTPSRVPQSTPEPSKPKSGDGPISTTATENFDSQQPHRRDRYADLDPNVGEKAARPQGTGTAMTTDDLHDLPQNSPIVKLSSPIGQHIVNVILQLAAIVAAIAFGYFAVESVQVANQANSEAHLANQIAIYAICNSINNPSGRLPDFCTRINRDANAVFPTAATALFTATPPTSTTSATSGTTAASASTAASSSNVTRSSSSSATITASASSASTTISALATTPTSVTSSITITTIATSTPTSMSSSSSPSGSFSSNRSKVLAISIAIPVGVLSILAAAWIFFCRSRRRRRRTQIPYGGTGWAAVEVTAQEGANPRQDFRSRRRPLRVAGADAVVEKNTQESLWRKWWRAYRNFFVDSTIST